MNIVKTDTSHPDFVILIHLLDIELQEQYGAVQALYDEHNKTGVLPTALVGYLDEIPVACGCFRRVDGQTVELKRMFVRKDHRGLGLSTLLLQALEDWAMELGHSHAILETGTKQLAAMKLYEKAGYEVMEQYEPYVGMETSLCMKKRLA